MASTLDSAVRYLRTPKAVGLAAAVTLSIVGAYATGVILPSADVAFLVIIVLGVSVPTTLESYDLLPPSPGAVVLRVVVACLAHWVVFLALYVAATRVVGGTFAAAIAFVVTVLAGAVVGRSIER